MPHRQLAVDQLGPNEHLEGASALVLQDYDKGALSDPGPLVTLAREAGVLSAALTSTDEAPIPPLDLAGARTWFGALAGAGVVALLSLLAPAVLGAALPAVAGWFNPFDAWGLAARNFVTMDRFGFGLLEPSGTDWQLTLSGSDGTAFARCTVVPFDARCAPLQ